MKNVLVKNVLAMVLAGGEGKRLYPLTKDRAKPAVPFGGKYRIIDFVLNNFVNSGVYKIKIITQFKSDSLNQHIARAWPMSPFLGHYVEMVPAQMRHGPDWYQGTADAIYQNINLIHDEMPEYVFVFGGDHIYKMDVTQMLGYHQQKDADLTIAAIPVPSDQATPFGVIEIDENYRIIGWEEKPQNPKEIPGRPGWSLVSMGNYVFNREVLVEELEKDAKDQDSKHDFGHNVIKKMMKTHNVFVYDFYTNAVPGAREIEGEQDVYWRDVGDIDSYWEAHMDLVDVSPAFDLYNKNWPIRTHSYQAPPSKFVFDQEDRRGTATDSIVAGGCIISGGKLNRCVISPYCRINSFSSLEECILMHGVTIGRHAKIKRAIIDKGVDIPPHTEIGIDADADRARGFYVSPGGVTVIAKGTVINPVEVPAG